MLETAPLGKATVYTEHYAPELLFAVPRSLAREKAGIDSSQLPFHGVDIWNGFELSWLNSKGKPQIATATFHFPCNSPFLIESKSFKLYLNSFNQTVFSSFDEVEQTLTTDLSRIACASVQVQLSALNGQSTKTLKSLPGTCLDDQDVNIDTYEVCADFLSTSEEFVEETLYSNLLKSNCLATGQPDWGTLWIHYKGPKINPEGLLKYIVSFRRHSGFAEHCVEEIYQTIASRCRPTHLSVYARYTRRGGLDINPFRSNFEDSAENTQSMRQ